MDRRSFFTVIVVRRSSSFSFVLKFSFSPRKLIDFSLLTGCDYTEGVQGIGTVGAMEILSHFDSLEAFKEAYDDLGFCAKENQKSRLTPAEKKRIEFVKRMQKKELVFPSNFPSEEGFIYIYIYLFFFSLLPKILFPLHFPPQFLFLFLKSG